MSITTTGIVQKVTKGKPFKYTVGPQAGKEAVTSSIHLDTDEGTLIVQRNGLTTSNFDLEAGTKVQVTYDVTTSANGQFTNNKIAKDGLLVLDESGETLQVTASGSVKPKYVPGQTGGSSKGYDSDGARNGMIIKAALDLATARANLGKTGTLNTALDLADLKNAADDIKALTVYVESGAITITSGTVTIENGVATNKTPSNAVQKKQIVKSLPKRVNEVSEVDDFDDEDSPFDLDD